MIYSLSYKCAKKQEADEIKCPWNQLGEIWGLIKDDHTKRINIILTLEADMTKVYEQVDIVKSAGNDYTLAAAGLSQLQDALSRGYNAYVMMPITDWESLDIQLKMGVSDVYIDGPLGFCLKDVSELAHAAGANVRITPQVSPNTAALPAAAHSFFIRPEDLPLYSPYIDIIDFITSDTKKQDTLFSIYKRGSFSSAFNLLFENSKEVILNSLLRPDLAEARLDCEQKCLIPGYSCHVCENEFELARNLELYAKSHET